MNDEKVLQHQLEEWKYLNDYVNKMDTGYQQTFVLIVTLLTGIVAFISKDMKSTVVYGIFLVPPGIIAMLAYKHNKCVCYLLYIVRKKN